MLSYQQQGSSTSGPANFFLSSPPSLVFYSSSHPSDHKPFSGRGLRFHMHTHRNKHTGIYYVRPHIDTLTNTRDRKSVHAQKQKCVRKHTDSCIIASSGLSLCEENIQGLEGLEASEGQRERKGGWVAENLKRDRKRDTNRER